MKDLVFVTAQPDVPYFHWQCEVYGHNFVEKGIKPEQIHMIFSIFEVNGKESEGALKLRKKGYNVHFYTDKRIKKHYIPSIKPYLISQWLNENPHFGKMFFLHDADIIFRELPNIESYLKDDQICYLSDTRGYIGYKYITSCCERYEKNFPNCEKNQLINEMVDVIGIDIDLVKENQDNSGGGQYIIKNTNYKLWNKIYSDSIRLYDKMLDFKKRFPLKSGDIQFWTAEMWALLWNLWVANKQTKIVEELSFCWATDSVQNFGLHPILHMAGVVESMKNTKFFKGGFININPLEKLRENENYFDYIDEKSVTTKYIEVMKSLIKKNK
jgi:hypothetical protein